MECKAIDGNFHSLMNKKQPSHQLPHVFGMGVGGSYYLTGPEKR